MSQKVFYRYSNLFFSSAFLLRSRAVLSGRVLDHRVHMFISRVASGLWQFQNFGIRSIVVISRVKFQ